MLRCASDDRTTIDIIKGDLLIIFESIPKTLDSELLSLDLAHIRRDNSAPLLERPRKLSLDDESGESTTHSSDTLKEDQSST